MDEIPFKAERIVVTDGQLVDWKVTERNEQGTPLEIAGPCPKCGHNTKAELPLDVLSEAQSGEGLALLPPQERMTRIVECRCGHDHPVPETEGKAASAEPQDEGPETPAILPGCGRQWLVSVALADATEPVVRAGDESLLNAAVAVKDELRDEEQRVRNAAEKWIAGIAALLSLFGLSGVIVGKDAIDGIPTIGAILAGILAALALIAAAVAVFLSYRAAYGWPVPVDISNDVKLRGWFDDRRSHVFAAGKDLRAGVGSACVALGVLALALAVIWFWPRNSPTPTVKVTSTDDSFVCGELISTKTDGTVRVRSSDGDVKVQPASNVRKISIESKC